MPEAFPGAEGWGADNRHFMAGGVPTVKKVTNLNVSGAGSFKAAVEASGPRIVVFEVGGVVENAGIITLSNDYCYIAGQTAPNPGFQLRGATLRLDNVSNVCIQHINIGRGDDPSISENCLFIQSADDVIVDHCSFYWATGDAVFVNNCSRTTISHCLVGEPLFTGWGGDGVVLQSGQSSVGNNLSFHHNLIAHAHTRNAYARYQYNIEFAMNVIYNPGPDRGDWFDLRDINEVDKTLMLDIWSNTYRDGAGSGSGTYIIGCDTAARAPGGSSRIYAGVDQETGNIHYEQRPTDDSSDVWDVIEDTHLASGTFQSLTPVADSETLTEKTAAEAYATVVTNGNVGARPYDTDAIRTRILSEVVAQTGVWKDTPADGGDWPVVSPTVRTFVTPSDPFGDDDLDGFTNIERYIHENFTPLVSPHYNNFPPESPGGDTGDDDEDEAASGEVSVSSLCDRRYRALPFFNLNGDVVDTKYVDARTQSDVSDATLISKLKDCGN